MVESMVPLEALIEALRGDYDRACFLASNCLRPMEMAEIRRATPGGTMAEKLVEQYEQGHEDGYSDGFADGHEDGYHDGNEEGYDEGHEDGIKGLKHKRNRKVTIPNVEAL